MSTHVRARALGEPISVLRIATYTFVCVFIIMIIRRTLPSPPNSMCRRNIWLVERLNWSALVQHELFKLETCYCFIIYHLSLSDGDDDEYHHHRHYREFNQHIPKVSDDNIKIDVCPSEPTVEWNDKSYSFYVTAKSLT